MRPTILVSLVLGLLARELHAQGGDQRRGGGRWRDRDLGSIELKNVTYKHVEFETKSLAAGRSEYGIYLPPGYDDEANATRTYPWMIWLHGMSEDYRDFHFGGARVLDDAVGEGKLPRFVFVAASAPRRTLYANGEREGNVADLILKDLVLHVQTNFRVGRDRGDRALMGISLGGMAALRFALDHPELFGAVATHSAAVFPEDPAELPEQHRQTINRFGDRSGWFELLGNPIDKDKYQALNPMAIVRKVKDLHGLRIYFDAGSADRYGFGPANQKLDQVMQEAEIPHTFHLIDGGQHSWSGGTVQKALIDSLTFVCAGFARDAAPGAPAAAPPKGEQPPADHPHQDQAGGGW
ncbi:MAG: alpha/beta hydrolase-fold protein [Planctomycetota bacterium]